MPTIEVTDAEKALLEICRQHNISVTAESPSSRFGEGSMHLSLQDQSGAGFVMCVKDGKCDGMPYPATTYAEQAAATTDRTIVLETAAALARVYGENGEHPKFSRSLWQTYQNENLTTETYWVWVTQQLSVSAGE